MKKILILGAVMFAILFSLQAQKIVVDISMQNLTAYNADGSVFYECNCVTGDGNSTTTGSWYIFEKDKNYVSSEFDEPMPYAMKFGSRGQAIHQTDAAGIRSYMRVLSTSYGGTHGCVGVREYSASKLYNWVEVNRTKVIIQD